MFGFHADTMGKISSEGNEKGERFPFRLLNFRSCGSAERSKLF
jgi:hypothetical protein